MRLIDRDVLWKKVTTQIEYCRDVLDIIRSVPIIDADPVRHGKWDEQWTTRGESLKDKVDNQAQKIREVENLNYLRGEK